MWSEEEQGEEGRWWPSRQVVLSHLEPAACRGDGSYDRRAGGCQWMLSGGQAQLCFVHQLITLSKAQPG